MSTYSYMQPVTIYFLWPNLSYKRLFPKNFAAGLQSWYIAIYTRFSHSDKVVELSTIGFYKLLYI